VVAGIVTFFTVNPLIGIGIAAGGVLVAGRAL